MDSPASNGRFGASGAVARLKVCANLEVYRPSLDTDNTEAINNSKIKVIKYFEKLYK